MRTKKQGESCKALVENFEPFPTFECGYWASCIKSKCVQRYSLLEGEDTHLEVSKYDIWDVRDFCITNYVDGSGETYKCA